jgi:broad specificity phosphatase PhoE/ribonuclease HI
MIFIYADGASRGNPGPAAYGVHIQDDKGTTIADFGEAIGIATNNQAEYAGVIAGLRFASQLGEFLVTIRMDSKLVVEQLSGRWKIKNANMAELAAEAMGLLRDFDAKLEWIPREQNSAADANANRALDSGNFESRGDSQIELATIQPRSIRAPRQTVEPTTVVVVRHGHTVNTEKNLISGGDGTDPELSKLGFWEVERAAEATTVLLEQFGLPELSKVYHSPMLRTTQTALAIGKGLPMVPDARLREIGFGEWEMASMADLETDAVAEVAAWRGSLDSRPPGGESVNDLAVRVQTALQEIVSANRGQTVAIATHMMPTRAIAAYAMPGASSIHFGINSSPGGISIYRFFADFAEVFTVNSCAHLLEK